VTRGDGVLIGRVRAIRWEGSDRSGAEGETRILLRDDGLDIQGSMRGRDGPYRR
jgi:hypothetical protein